VLFCIEYYRASYPILFLLLLLLLASKQNKIQKDTLLHGDLFYVQFWLLWIPKKKSKGFIFKEKENWKERETEGIHIYIHKLLCCFA